MKPINVWKFIPEDCRLSHGDGRLITAPDMLTLSGDPVCCKYGFHGSETLRDALQYCPSNPRLTLSRIGGRIDRQPDKIAGSVLYTDWIATREETDRYLRLWGVWCARQVLHLVSDPHRVVCAATLDTAERYARGWASVSALAAASAAARDAARDAAGASARDAALSAASAAASAVANAVASATASAAARDAARDAASAAANAAASAAARDAAMSAAMSAANAAASAAARDAAMSAARDAAMSEQEVAANRIFTEEFSWRGGREVAVGLEVHDD
jgi:hypothetical protein